MKSNESSVLSVFYSFLFDYLRGGAQIERVSEGKERERKKERQLCTTIFV